MQFFYCLTRMANISRLDERLDHLESILRVASNQTQQTEEKKRNLDPFKNSQSCFKLKAEDVIKTAKNQIFTLISSLKQESISGVITASEQNIIRIVENKLLSLNNSVDQLLSDGALTLYMDLCEIRDHQERTMTSNNTTKLIKEIIDSLLDLVQLYFVFQEYSNSQLISEQNKENTIQSKNRYINFNFTDQNQRHIREIEQRLTSIPFHVLLGRECANLQKRMKEDLIKCRICEDNIQLGNMEKHVRICQKKNSLKQQLQEKNYLMNNLLLTLKERHDQLNTKGKKQKVDQDFKKLAKLIIKTEVISNNIDRRCSLMCSTKEKSMKDNIQTYIEDYMNEYGQHELLRSIVTNYKDKVYLQKKINSLETNFIDQLKQKHMNGRVDIRSDQKIKKQCVIIFNGLQNKTLQKSLSSSSLSDNEIEQQIEKSASFEKMSKIKSTKFKSRTFLQDIENEDLNVFKNYSSLHNISQTKEDEITISLQNFQIISFLGQGAFGKVYMVRRKETQDIYALKIIKFSEAHGDKDLQSIENEHQIFKKIGGDHLVKAPFSFSERSCQMFVLQYLPGGDLRKMLDEEVYFDEERAKFYLAEIILAIQHLHKFGIIHRDLKPQNLVIDKNGHLKLTDFGLSEWQINKKLQKERSIEENNLGSSCRKVRKRRTAVLSNGSQKRKKLIGTPDYIAPQIINGISLNNFTIDWWSLGVMAYELLIGARPFCAETIEQVIDNIINFKLEWPQVGYEEGMISPEGQSFICQLLNKDFTKRLGAQGADELKKHSYLKDIDWQNIKTSKPSFLPQIANVRDYSKKEEDKSLRDEIDEFIGRGDTKSKKNQKNIKLQRFVRYDILGSETIETVQKIHKQHTIKLKKLRTLHDICLGE